MSYTKRKRNFVYPINSKKKKKQTSSHSHNFKHSSNYVTNLSQRKS